MRFEREVTRIEEADDRTRNIALKGLSTRRKKERIILAPYRQERRLVRAEVFLERGIQRDIALVVTEEVELNFISAGARQIEVVEILTIRRHHRFVRYPVRVLPARRLRSEEGAERLSVCSRWVLPVRPDRTPAIAQTFLIGIAILRDDGHDPLGVVDGEPKTRRCAVVKDIDCEAVEADNLCEAFDHASDVIERVAEFFSRRHVGFTEPPKVCPDHIKPVRQQPDQITKHVARAREAMQ